MTDGIRNFMYSKHNGDNAKLKIFSFIRQQQRIQPNFMNDSIRTFVHTNQLKNTCTTRTTKTTTSTWISLVTQILYSYNWDNANSPVSLFKLCQKLADFIHFINHKFCTFHWTPKICTWIAEQFRTFHSSLHESITLFLALKLTNFFYKQQLKFFKVILAISRRNKVQYMFFWGFQGCFYNHF